MFLNALASHKQRVYHEFGRCGALIFISDEDQISLLNPLECPSVVRIPWLSPWIFSSKLLQVVDAPGIEGGVCASYKKSRCQLLKYRYQL